MNFIDETSSVTYRPVAMMSPCSVTRFAGPPCALPAEGRECGWSGTGSPPVAMKAAQDRVKE
jgi:hypothetical protein